MRGVLGSVGFFLVVLLPLRALTADFSGQWQSDFGVVDLQQQRDSASGSYSCCGNGTLEGQVDGNQFQFKRQDPGNGLGWGSFTLSADGDSFTGIWGDSSSTQPKGSWNGTRLVKPAHLGTESHWDVTGKNDLGTLKAQAKLYIAENRVTGWLKGVNTITLDLEDSPAKTLTFEIANELEGRTDGARMYLNWTDPLQGTVGTMELVIREPDRRMEGTWQADDGTSGTIVMSAKGADDEPGSGRSLLTEPDSLNVADMAAASRQTARAERLLHEATDLVDTGEHQKARELYLEAEALFRATANTNKIGYALLGIAGIDAQKGRYEDARQGYAAILDLGADLDDEIRLDAEFGLLEINSAAFGQLPEDLGRALPQSSVPDEPLPESLRHQGCRAGASQCRQLRRSVSADLASAGGLPTRGRSCSWLHCHDAHSDLNRQSSA